MKVLKFGGSTLITAQNIENVKNIIHSEPSPAVVVISAFGATTDKLVEATELATDTNCSYGNIVKEIKDYFHALADQLFDSQQKEEVLNEINPEFINLENILKGTCLVGELSKKAKDRILALGEYLSAVIFHAYFGDAIFIDARNIIKTDSNFGKANIDFEETSKLVKHALSKHSGKTIIIPGFIASNNKGETTTLGRGGSDYTASVIASVLKADALEIWTDVDGFLTADPKKVGKAFAIEQLSYAEAMELSHFGAKVIYTPTIQPVLDENIPIFVKNAFDPAIKGTVISNSSGNDDAMIKGVSSIEEINLISVHGPGLVGTKGLSGRLFTALAKNEINIILITQASSEYSISFAVNPEDADSAVEVINHEFENEISAKGTIKIGHEKNLAIVAIVGEKMRHRPGISANLFQSLGRNGINIAGIAQGSSELNISVVIERDSLKKALNVIHEGFFLSHAKEIHLFLVGTGVVGGALIDQIKQQQEELLQKQHLKINVVGLADIDNMIINADGLNLNSVRNEIKTSDKVDLDRYTDIIRELNLRNSIFVDCTASPKVASYYEKMLGSFVSVVAANKIACSSEQELYEKLKTTAVKSGVKFMYETNVGAGLPIINTIQNLMNSGDKIVSIEAVLSGTLNFVFNELSEHTPLSKAIMLAKEKGFSEPDPRIDLSGIDVIRKILILAREAGYKLEQKEVEIKSFLPRECFEGTLDDFWENVKKQDAIFEEQRKELVKENKRWRFVARLDDGKASVELMAVDVEHPSYPLVGSNNIVLLTTRRYKEQPLIIRGYGAGAEVTAAGVFGDIMQVAHV